MATGGRQNFQPQPWLRAYRAGFAVALALWCRYRLAQQPELAASLPFLPTACAVLCGLMLLHAGCEQFVLTDDALLLVNPANLQVRRFPRESLRAVVSGHSSTLVGQDWVLRLPRWAAADAAFVEAVARWRLPATGSAVVEREHLDHAAALTAWHLAAQVALFPIAGEVLLWLLPGDPSGRAGTALFVWLPALCAGLLWVLSLGSRGLQSPRLEVRTGPEGVSYLVKPSHPKVPRRTRESAWLTRGWDTIAGVRRHGWSADVICTAGDFGVPLTGGDAPAIVAALQAAAEANWRRWPLGQPAPIPGDSD